MMKKKIIIIVLIILGLLTLLLVKNRFKEDNELSYEILNKYNRYDFECSIKGYYVETFNDSYYYIITMGSQSSGGYSIAITDVKADKNNNVEVIVREIAPEKGQIVTMSFTCPTVYLKLTQKPQNIVIKNTDGELYEILDNTNSKSINDLSIYFQEAEYESIDDVVFYKNQNISENDKENFKQIASAIKKYHPGKQIVYEYSMGDNLYRFRQFMNGYIIDNTWMNVNSNGAITFTIGSDWKDNLDLKKPIITYQEAIDLTNNYLKEHPNDLNILNNGVCIVELNYYNQKTIWNMHFIAVDSYIKIDANTGEIIDTYFFSGEIID